MMSLPDFKEKQLLFVPANQVKDCKIQFWNDNIRLLSEGKAINQVSIHKIFAIFIIGETSITTKLIRDCMEHGISLFLLKSNFEVYATIGALAEGNYVLREKQYNLKGELDIAKGIVKNKVYSQFQNLYKAKIIKRPIAEYKKACIKIDEVANLKELLGTEGYFTKIYFAQYFKEHKWYKRMPRTKVDPTNLLMDIGYTFLFNLTDAMLRLYGFDTYKGVYHQLFFQRKSLACDLMEPLRCLIDRQIVKAYNLGQIRAKDFKLKNGTYFLPYDCQREYLKLLSEAIWDRKEEVFCYIRDYYYFVMNGDREMPVFKI
ncbi:MAG TPA: hypothetical protein DCY49_02930 [Candidatus Jacksonbacteria bacterium]|nr:hypothetical protein [Candidatus Jacksonbacteria bacterium]